MPTDPTAPVNHFHVIAPENRVDGVDYEAYWFGTGESLVAVKDGLLIRRLSNLCGCRRTAVNGPKRVQTIPHF